MKTALEFRIQAPPVPSGSIIFTIGELIVIGTLNDRLIKAQCEVFGKFNLWRIERTGPPRVRFFSLI